MTTMPNEEIGILVVDDERSVRDSLTHWLEEDGFRVVAAAEARAALDALKDHRFDIVLLDIKLPGMDGMELLKRIKSVSPELAVVMITAFASVETAVQALKDGAFDYITKPFDPDELSRLIRRAVQQRALIAENVRLKASIDRLTNVDSIVGRSEAIRRVIDVIETVSGTDATVLIRGETGTGKELVARAIHANSPRRYFPIISMNCGAVPDNLLESELFGHERGAFTGAQYRRKGKLELANGGSLFLDEIGNVSIRMQQQLLRVLETKRFTRLGGSVEVESDFRLISATNCDLELAMREGRFRDDLYYRLNVFRVDIPPLRDRREDIAPLAEYFVESFAHAMNRPVSGISPEGVRLLEGYTWPGNVRELRNVIERAMVVCRSERVEPVDLRYQFPGLDAAPQHPTTPPPVPSPTAGDESGDESLTAIEREHISHVLAKYEGNISRAARALQIDRATLYNKIRKYELDR